MNKDSKNSCANCDRLAIQLAEKDREIQALLAKIEDLTRHDPLTGVLNRRTLTHILTAELQRSYRTGQPFCFAIINLDHFRNVNQKYGHPVGDIVLKTIAETATNLLRVLDRFGRLGGEEFGIILPATWLDQGVLAMNRLTKAVTECAWDHLTPGQTVTFSTGITTNAPGDTAESVIKRAEKALYQAKSEGRNRIVQAEEPLPEGVPIDLD
jgi:diguanylate cyclase (GGDEF)-like protein